MIKVIELKTNGGYATTKVSFMTTVVVVLVFLEVWNNGVLEGLILGLTVLSFVDGVVGE